VNIPPLVIKKRDAVGFSPEVLVGDGTARPVRTATSLIAAGSLLSNRIKFLFGQGGLVTVLVEKSPVGEIRTWVTSPLPQHKEEGLGYMARLKEDMDGGYVATIPTLRGCVTEGDTPEEALKHLRDAIEGWIEIALEKGLDIPPPDRSVSS